MKGDARRLASLCRFLRIEAVTKHRYYRLVLEMDKNRYQVEQSQEPFVIAAEEEEKLEATEPEGEKLPEEVPEEAAKETFEKAESSLLRETALGKTVFFKDVAISYLPTKREKGRVRVYFFPDGYVTPAVINLRDEDDEDHYSIAIAPLSGKVTVAGEYRDLEK